MPAMVTDLGEALFALGLREDENGKLEESVAAFHEALKEETPKQRRTKGQKRNLISVTPSMLLDGAGAVCSLHKLARAARWNDTVALRRPNAAPSVCYARDVTL